MLISGIDYNFNKQRYAIPTFQGRGSIKFYSCNFDLGKDVDTFIRKDTLNIFLEKLKPSCRKTAREFMELPTYDKFTIPLMSDLKASELKYLYKLASKKDSTGEIRIPKLTFHLFSQIPEERLKILEPLILSKNDMGLWNYSPSFILHLNEEFSDYQINVMSRLADCHVNGTNLRQIATNPYINHEKTIEKAQGLKQIFGDKLREIEFHSNRNGENFLSADIQLPHSDDKPDYMNFKRVFSLLDNDVNPTAKKSKMTELDSYIDNIYENLEKRMYIFSAKELESSINEVKNAVSKAEEFEILRTMQKLTQFANYTSLQKIAGEINHELHPVGGINPYFYYFSKKKNIFDLPISNDCVKSSFVTKDDIHSKDFNKTLNRLQGSDIEWINLEGFSDGVNLFTDDKTLAEKTIRVLKRAKKLQNKNEEYTFNDALSVILNREIISGMRNLGFEVKTITTDAPATRDVILSQINPEMPTKSLFKSTIESISAHYTQSTKSKKFKNMCMKIADYYENNLQVYSKQRIIESLKLLQEKIYQYARINNVKSENVYYVLPNVSDSEYKSFELITKMYCNLFDIQKEQIVRINTFKEINEYPKNSVFVLLDDIAGSGDSMAKFGDYIHCAKGIAKDKHVFFAPVSAMNKGVNYLKGRIKDSGRESLDMVLNIYGNTIFDSNIAGKFLAEGDTKINSEVIGETGYNNAGLCSVFPYMGPNNDSELASYIIKFFVPDARCIKTKTEVLPVIEENTYYYDVFGTDKEHVLADASRVYNPDKPNIIETLFKKLFK